MTNISSSMLRISGLATGLDTESIIKQLMDVERAPLDRLLQSKQLLEWRQNDYRDINTKLLNLKTEAFNMKLSTAYKKYTASSSNTAVVTATATSGASATTYTLNSITSLAKSSNIATADGQSISRDTSVVTGGVISTSIDTDANNTFKINFDGGGFVDITLDAGKVYDGTTPGGLYSDLVNDIQTKIDAALGADKVKVSLNGNNYIQFTANDYPTNAAPKTIVLQEGDTNDILKEKLGFATNSTTKQISSTIKDIDLNESIYRNIQQHRFKNTEDFDWIVNGSDVQTFGVAADNMISTVDYNSTNLSNYYLTTIENENQVIADTAKDNIATTINYNATNYSNLSVYVNGTKYTVVFGKAQEDLGETEALFSDDGTGKVKLTFKEEKDVGTQIQINSSTRYTVVTGKTQEELTGMEALIEDDGTGKAKFTFKNQLQAGTKINVDRHDFAFSTSVYNQDGVATDTTFTVNAYSETMNTLMSKISSSATSGVSAFYDTGTDKIVFNAKKTGDNNISGNDISLTGSFLTTALQMTKYAEGNDAVFSINGLATTRKENSFNINGVSFTLKSTSETPVDVTISQDTDSIFDSIKAFVDKYNEIAGNINTKLSEKRDRDYAPLTDAQKESMKDDDITLWESKAKSGLLNGDPLLSRIVNRMRTSLYDQVSGTANPNYNRLSSIGITTCVYYQEKGKLVIDEAKLKTAISENPEEVIELFTKVSTATDATQKYQESGLIERLYTNVSNAVKDLITKAGQDNGYLLYDNSTLGQDMRRLESQISLVEDRLEDKETNYYKKFSALETAINKMNAQSAWLSQQFSSSSSN